VIKTRVDYAIVREQPYSHVHIRRKSTVVLGYQWTLTWQTWRRSYNDIQHGRYWQ